MAAVRGAQRDRARPAPRRRTAGCGPRRAPTATRSTTSPGCAVGASRETIHRCPSGSTTTPPRPYGASVTGRSSTAPAATAAATTPSGSGGLQPQRLARPAAAHRRPQADLGELVGEHEDGVADPDLDVPDPPVGHHVGIAAADGPERRDVERDARAGIDDGEVRGEGVHPRRGARWCERAGHRFLPQQGALHPSAEGGREGRVGVDGPVGRPQCAERIGLRMRHRVLPS